MMKPKFFTLLKNRPEEFTPHRLLKDISAGLVVACVALPLSIALAIASGVTPEKGLLTAIVAGFFISLLGGSRVQIGGPTGAFVVIVYGIIAEFGLSGLLTATLMAGVLLILMGLFKMGSLLKFIPYPVVTGFTSGIAVVLFSTQINDFLGLSLTQIPADFFGKWQVYLAHITQTSWATLGVGLFALGIIAFWPKKWKVVPGSLVALLLSVLAVKGFNLNVATITSTFGTVDSTLSLPHLPGPIDWEQITRLARPAFTIAMLAGIESLLSAVVADGMIGKKHRSNTELMANGVANIVSALFGGLPATGAIARTTANIENGGRTPIAGMAHAVFLLLMMICFMPYIGLIPMPALSAVLFLIAYRMSNWRSFVALFKAPKADIAVLMTAFVLTVVADLVVAIELGLLLAMLLFMKRMSDVAHIKNSDDDLFDEVRHRDDIDTKIISQHVTVFEISGPFFFGAAAKFVDSLADLRECRVLILRMRSVPTIDATGYHALEQIYNHCQRDHIDLILSHVQKPVLRTLEKYGFTKELGEDRFCKNIDMSLMRAESLIKKRESITE